MTNEERIAKWRRFKQLVAMNPKRYRICHHKDSNGGLAFSLQEFVKAHRHHQDPFFYTVVHSLSGGRWDWTIVAKSDAWFPPIRKTADAVAQSVKAM